MEIVYSIEDEPLGTGGAIAEALKFVDQNSVYILNGDTIFDINLNNLKLDDSKICIALKHMNNFDRYGSVNIDKNHITISPIDTYKDPKYYSHTSEVRKEQKPLGQNFVGAFYQEQR